MLGGQRAWSIGVIPPRNARRSRACVSWLTGILCLGGCAEVMTTQERLVACANPILGVDRAIAACTAILQGGGETRDGLVRVLQYRGVAYFVRHQPDRAFADYDEAIRLDPANAGTFVARGLHHHREGHPGLALRDHDEAVRLTPREGGFLMRRGDLHARQDHPGPAREDYGNAIRIEPGNARFLLGRADFEAGRGHFAAAIPDYDAAILLGAGPLSHLAFHGRGKAYRSLGQTDRAEADAARAAELDPRRGEPPHEPPPPSR